MTELEEKLAEGEEVTKIAHEQGGETIAARMCTRS